MFCTLLSLLLFGGSQFAHANTYAPTSFIDGVTTTNLRGAIIAANSGVPGSTINLKAGTYTLSIQGMPENAAANGDLDITQDLTINGAGAGVTFIDGNSLNDRIFHILGGANIHIFGVTILNGNPGFPSGNGGGVLNEGTLTLDRCTVTGNSSGTALGNDSGGGIYSIGTLILMDTTVSMNSAVGGGSHGGGGICLAAGTMTMTGCTVNGNTTNGRGGAIYNLATMDVTNSTLSGNQALNGGGVFNIGVTNLDFCTVVSNTATTAVGLNNTSGMVNLENTIVSGNPANGQPNCVGTITSVAFNLSSSNDTSFTFINTDPLLDLLADNGGPTKTHALLTGSPAIDNGPTTSPISTDQRGFLRPVGVACDIGAYEAGPLPKVELKVPAQVLIGEDFTFTVTFENTSGVVGYAPFVDLVLPTAGIDGAAAIMPISCDGISFTTPVPMLVDVTPTGVPVPYDLNPVMPVCSSTPNDVSQLQHPFLVPPVTTVTGEQLLTLRLPFGSFEPDQPKIVVQITAHVSNLADVNMPLCIRARGGFRFGTNPLGDPTTDPPVVTESESDSMLWGDVNHPNSAVACATPALFILKKRFLSACGEDEAVPGVNFTSYYPLQYAIDVDIASGQTIDSLTITDTLPPNLQFVSVTSISPGGGSQTSTPSITSPGGVLAHQWPSITGGTHPDATLVFDFYIPERDDQGDFIIDQNNCTPALATDDARVEGDWNSPIDMRDGTNVPVVSDVTPNDHTLNVRCLALQKGVALLTDLNEPGLTPGDTLQYTLKFQASDYLTFGNLVCTDTLSDGQTFVPGSAQVFIEDINGNVNIPITSNSGLTVTDPLCVSNGPGAPSDRTTLEFNLSTAMLGSGGVPFNTGILTGGKIPNTSPNSPTHAANGRIIFNVTVDEEYKCPVTPGDKYVDKDDPLINRALLTAERLDNMTLQPIGVIASDSSETEMVIVPGTLTKTVYAINGNTNVTQPYGVNPGDTITFRITKTIPSGDAEPITIQDFFPLPVLNESSVMVTTLIGNDVPLVLPTHNSGDNTITFNYPAFSGTTSRTINLLVTATAGNDPFADGLDLTNEAFETETNTFGDVFPAIAIAQFRVQEPSLKITKGVVACTNPQATFSPPLPNLPMFTPVGSAGTRFTGSIISTGLLAVTPISSSLAGALPNDQVTFAIIVENQGNAVNGAFDVIIKDDLPLTLPLCFNNIGNIHVTDGTGNPTMFVGSPASLFTTGLKLVDPNATTGALAPTHPHNGKNIVVITYDATFTPSSADCCTNKVKVDNYSNLNNGKDFVTAGFGVQLSAEAQVCPAQPDLTITKVAAGPFAVGIPGVYTLTVTNIGAGPAYPPVIVTDTFPTGLKPVLPSDTADWHFFLSGQTLTCTYIGQPVAAGGIFPPITATVDVCSGGDFYNCAAVSGPNDINPNNNTDCVSVVVIDDPYSSWASQYPSVNLNDRNADADGDGKSNFYEYAFGLDPTSGASLNAIVTFLKPDGTFIYNRRKQSLTCLTYTIQYSCDLANWTVDNAAVENVISTVGDTETVKVTLSAAATPCNGKLFVRIKVVQ